MEISLILGNYEGRGERRRDNLDGGVVTREEVGGDVVGGGGGLQLQGDEWVAGHQVGLGGRLHLDPPAEVMELGARESYTPRMSGKKEEKKTQIPL